MQIDVEAIPQMNLANYCRISALILAAEPRDGGNNCRKNKAVACKVAKSLKTAAFNRSFHGEPQRLKN